MEQNNPTSTDCSTARIIALCLDRHMKLALYKYAIIIIVIIIIIIMNIYKWWLRQQDFSHTWCKPLSHIPSISYSTFYHNRSVTISVVTKVYSNSDIRVHARSHAESNIFTPIPVPAFVTGSCHSWVPWEIEVTLALCERKQSLPKSGQNHVTESNDSSISHLPI